MKIILIISMLLNVILIYNLGKYKQTIDRKDKFINKWIDKERDFNNICEDCKHSGIGRGYGNYAIHYCNKFKMDMPATGDCENFIDINKEG